MRLDSSKNMKYECKTYFGLADHSFSLCESYTCRPILKFCFLITAVLLQFRSGDLWPERSFVKQENDIFFTYLLSDKGAWPAPENHTTLFHENEESSYFSDHRDILGPKYILFRCFINKYFLPQKCGYHTQLSHSLLWGMWS